MMRFIIFILLLVQIHTITAETTEIPQWFHNNMSLLEGVWTTDNSTYFSDQEPYKKYAIEWHYGLGHLSLTGRLYGIKADGSESDLWQFRQYWDNTSEQGMLIQFGYNNVIGRGQIKPLESNKTESIQIFSQPDGNTWQEKHLTVFADDQHTTTSYALTDQDWQEKRTYQWHKQHPTRQEKVTSRVETLASGELMLTQEMTINAPVEKLWNAYTNPDEWKKWVTPVVEMDFRINGTIKSHYDPQAKIGDPGTIIIHILNYIPGQQITMQAELNENFPQFMQGEEKNLYSIVQFQPVDDATSQVTLYGIGYKNDPKWHDLLKFFIQGNETTLIQLKTYAEGS